MRHVFLFDIDGVLVDARGYLRAVQDTVAQFSHAMGLGDVPPTEPEVRSFEANGLSNEWDSGAACVGALLLARVAAEPEMPLPAAWSDLPRSLGKRPRSITRPDYSSLADAAGVHVRQGILASQAVLRELENRSQAVPLTSSRRQSLSLLLIDLLGDTHDIRSPFTWAMQQRVVGSDRVLEVYGRPPDIDRESYLSRFDVPNLSPRLRDRLLREVSFGRLCGAVYTARPSLPPREHTGSALGYSPEAEAAAALVGLDGWPLIGMGRMWWLARAHGLQDSALVKPSPVQALAAIGAALSGQEAESLEAALRLHLDCRPTGPLAATDRLVIHVFEDAPMGLEAARRAADELRRAGVDTDLREYGITPASGPKADSMAARGVRVFPSVNAAAEAALASL